MKNTIKKNSRKNIWKVAVIATFLLSMMLILSTTAFAAADGGSLDNTMSNFLNILFTVLRFAAVIAIAYGVVQLFMAISSHDASQRLQGIIFFVGGLIIFFVKNILEAIGVTI